MHHSELSGASHVPQVMINVPISSAFETAEALPGKLRYQQLLGLPQCCHEGVSNHRGGRWQHWARCSGQSVEETTPLLHLTELAVREAEQRYLTFKY